jgi:hypothetical protein
MAAACLACHKTIACSGLNLNLLERSKMDTSSNRISNLNAIVEHFASQIIQNPAVTSLMPSYHISPGKSVRLALHQASY